MKSLIRFLRDDDGPTAVEYAIMLAMIVAVCLVGIGLAGSSTADSFQDSFDQMDAAMNPEDDAPDA